VLLRKASVAGIAFAMVLATIGYRSGAAYADTVRTAEWHLEYLHVAAAQKLANGAGAVVAVVDSGVSRHQDLAGALISGYDVVRPGSDPTSDQDGHGTEMASLIAGRGRGHSSGILGIAPSAKILPVKATTTGGGGTSISLGHGISWAAQNGAAVINVSAGAGDTSAMRDGVTAAEQANSVVVAASGNRSLQTEVSYPAALPGVLAVGAIDRIGKPAAFSTIGPQVQICAPGAAIAAAEPPNKYVKIDGTSPATAIVSGAAALVRAKFPQLSAQEVIHRLTATATDIGKPGRDDECGYGVLNIVKALTANVPPLETATTAPTATPTATNATNATNAGPAPGNSPTTSGNGDASAASDTGGKTSKIVVGIVLIVVMAGGLLAFLLAWRRKKA
jgi:type VII secretion-associated serine protease mycosin